MNKKSLFSILASGIVIFLSGCSSLSIIEPAKNLTEPENSIFFKKLPRDNKNNQGLKILADQVLGKGHKCQNSSNNPQPAPGPKYYEDKAPLSDEMASAGTMKELMKSQCGENGDMSMGYSGMREFIDAMHKEYVRASSDNKVKQKIKDADDKLVFSKVLLTYAKTYYKGDFVLRDGTKLAKPSKSIGFNQEGVFTVSTDNDALIGLTTVFLEALSEFAFPTPVTANSTNKISYKQSYNQTSKTIASKEDPKKLLPLYELLYLKEEDKPDYLTESNLQPTVLTLKDKFFNGPPLVAEKEFGISEIELKAMRHISSNIADGSKMVLGTTLRSAGGAGLSFGAFAKLSIGDNDALVKIVETAIEVLSRRLLEYRLYKFLYNEPFEDELRPFFGD
ncbi:hypothetical protein SAMN05216428_101323 [Nitrosospira sp. Nsp11]|uniref:hypothetical protein n=1 Tax=Nitrosospira sp. Nsp11 TaxID=1855338 RepID=UPI0009155074|nr:hypothetical protein [Nitrosospira sp. Nsp11]SHL17098.1 hypothetical protein SAMN05216428_101323 [Nitrosospira sp. Nsp11]